MHGIRQGARHTLAAFTAVVAAVLLGASPAGAQPSWVGEPASIQARLQSDLFWLTLVLAAVVFILVESLIVYSALRFRRRAPLPSIEPPQVHGNTRLEVMWAIVPAFILIGLFAVSARTMTALQEAPPNAMRIGVTARQFQFDFTYLDRGGVRSSGELRLPVNQPVIFEITSVDVIHSFWIPELQGKLDAIPGRVNKLVVTPDVVRSYRGVCAELCGAGHANMLFRVEVVNEADFNQWLEQTRSGAAAAAAAAPSAEGGQQVFTAKGCGACHVAPGVPGAVGQVGPSLAGVAERAGTRKPGTSAEDYLRESLRQPNAFVVPGFSAAMPTLELTDSEVQSLIAFLQTLR